MTEAQKRKHARLQNFLLENCVLRSFYTILEHLNRSFFHMTLILMKEWLTNSSHSLNTEPDKLYFLQLFCMSESSFQLMWILVSIRFMHRHTLIPVSSSLPRSFVCFFVIRLIFHWDRKFSYSHIQRYTIIYSNYSWVWVYVLDIHLSAKIRV